jgi:uncharacterized protein YndB with AHSA1/START domain
MSNIRVKKDTTARCFEMSIDIDALADTVWDALTKAEELIRWFPLEARVIPGEGGSMYWGWGDGWAGESKIAGWEPHRRLKLVETRQGFDADGKPLAEPHQNRELVVEVTLESHAGSTRLRLVHSGFGHGANWDDELDGISTGWQCELRNLKHYVERFRGRDRVLAWAKGSSDLSPGEVWAKLFAPDGIILESASAAEIGRGIRLREGERYLLRLGSHRFEGTVAVSIPDDFVGYIDDLHGSMVRVGTFRGGGRTGMMLWAVSYDAGDAPRLQAFERDAQAFLTRTFTTPKPATV